MTEILKLDWNSLKLRLNLVYGKRRSKCLKILIVWWRWEKEHWSQISGINTLRILRSCSRSHHIGIIMRLPSITSSLLLKRILNWLSKKRKTCQMNFFFQCSASLQLLLKAHKAEKVNKRSHQWWSQAQSYHPNKNSQKLSSPQVSLNLPHFKLETFGVSWIWSSILTRWQRVWNC